MILKVIVARISIFFTTNTNSMSLLVGFSFIN
jgi:hypothetical protein